MQDAFWNVIRKIDLYRGDSTFRSWIYRIVSNASCQKRRTSATRQAHISLDDVLPPFHEDAQHAEPIVDWSQVVDDPARRTALRLALMAAIGDLPGDYHTAFLLHDVEGLSNAEVADALGVSVTAVKARVHRARLFLREGA